MPNLSFLKSVFASLDAEECKTRPRVLEIALPADAAKHFDDQAHHAVTCDREIHRSSERDLELAVPGAPLFRNLLEALGAADAALAGLR